MIYLILSILTSSIILAIFKGFEKYKVDTFQAIVWNYVTACSCGFLLYGSQWNSVALSEGNWKPYVALMAVLFISLFYLMGVSSQQNGVGSTTIANKMSLAISFLVMILFYHEAITVVKIAGIFLAIIAVFLLNYSPIKTERPSPKGILMLLVIFIGSGILDVLLNFANQPENLLSLTPNLFSAICFGGAGSIGLVILVIKIVRKQTKISLKNIVGGIVLGIPNYFSIYLLLKSYSVLQEEKNWSQSSILGLNNVLVVLVSTVLAVAVFKEKMNKWKAIGFVLAIVATWFLVVKI
jgi:drug/metabolite transporter (DMT)-like permease